tara:strand:+ start:428 stop:652 length:225 start_codon:yes stop_codon:yes gene_type:complete
MTKQELSNAFKILSAVAETIRELGFVPSGHLYTNLMGQMGLEEYTSLIDTLKRTKLVEEKYNVIYWIGPKNDEN